MATIKSHSDLQQSKKLAEILPIESADMYYEEVCNLPKAIIGNYVLHNQCMEDKDYKKLSNPVLSPAWSLSALLNILHSKTKNIPSLSGGGYKDGKYISDWCLDYEFDDGDYQKTFADNPVDACYEMIIRLYKLNLL